jgi:[protein-PII] uridylyltransferase
MANLKALDRGPLAGRTGRDVARERSDAVDDALEALTGDVPPSLAVAAVGGYGRRELLPGSDIDLMFLHSPEADPGLQQLVDAVLYPLWDSGLPVSHSVRTVAECRAESAARVESLTALLDGRPVAGSIELVGRAKEAAMDVISQDPRAFVEALDRSREDRRARFGSVGQMLEPDLKEALGGLRDIQVLRWMVRLTNRGEDTGAPYGELPSALVDALDFLLLARTALHRTSSSRSNRLLAEHHRAVAGELGIEDRPDWDARDGLMRTLFGHARRVDHLTDRALRSEADQSANGTRSRAPRDLIALLSEPDAPAILRAEDAAGRLASHLPEWDRVRGRPQRDPYHRFPVDVHLIETFAEVVRHLREPDEPFAAEAASSIGDPTPLLLGAVLHDIGKIGRGSHVQTGMDVAARALDHLEVKGELRDDVLFLVGEHLLLSDTATRRNLEDEDLILHVAARVRDERRLALLYLLTVADAHATGPTASSPWRLGLIRELVAKVSHAFERGLMDRDRAGRLAQAESRLREALASARVPSDEAEAFLTAVPTGYALWVPAEEAADHVALIVPEPGPTEVRSAVRRGKTPATYRLSVGAVDRLGLLAAAAGAMTLSGLSILAAQAFTTEDGRALDVFEVRGAFEAEVRDHRWERFRSSMTEVLEGSLDLRERVHSLRAHYRPAPRGIPVNVRLDQEASDFFTVVEVSAPDRLGLLFDLASTISEHDLDVHVAKVATYAERVVDVFYVRDADGQKVTDPARSAELERALTSAASLP